MQQRVRSQLVKCRDQEIPIDERDLGIVGRLAYRVGHQCHTSYS